jgi:predicted NUDIX family NTP pyrophosphohydrolase
MPRRSAGLLMYRWHMGNVQVLLAHPGGPLFARKDHGHWSIPKGEPDGDEELLATAIREFEEETGFKPSGPYIPLSPIQQKGGKIVHAWAFAGDCDPTALQCVTFSLEWPPKSGRYVDFPEVDRVEFCTLEMARQKLKPAQVPLVEQLLEILAAPPA